MLDPSQDLGGIDVKITGSVLERKSTCIIIRTTSKKNRAFVRSIEVPLYLYKSTINGLVLKTVVMYALEFQSAN